MAAVSPEVRMASTQIFMPANIGDGFDQRVPPLSQCHKIWVYRFSQIDSRCSIANFQKDNRVARFTPCALPYITTIPAILSALVLLTYSLRLFDSHRPAWTKPFIKEEKEHSDELSHAFWSRPSSSTFGLLFVAMIGLTMQVLASFIPSPSFYGLFPSITWVRVRSLVL